MKSLTVSFIMTLILTACSAHAQGKNPMVAMQTSMGTIVLELDAQKAPKTVANFISYVNQSFYNGTTFHRVIKGFMIQGGGFDKDMRPKTTDKPIMNEADNGLLNTIGTIAMARTPYPHSATSQFFINTADNAFLNHKAKTNQGWGYCVFGRVVQGMEVVKAIESVKTTVKAGQQDVPAQPVVIESLTLIKKQAPDAAKTQ
jgi:cyclophilin family peptidyl-prolyl cis-trans isomerase